MVYIEREKKEKSRYSRSFLFLFLEISRFSYNHFLQQFHGENSKHTKFNFIFPLLSTSFYLFISGFRRFWGFVKKIPALFLAPFRMQLHW